MRTPILTALASALLFGTSTPLAKVLVAQLPPLALAGVLYLGAGAGLLVLRWLWRSLSRGEDSREAPVFGGDWGWLAGAILAGGVVAPVLLLLGLQHTQAAPTALLLNLEGVFTAFLAWLVFHENVDRRIATGFFLIAGAGVLLSWEGAPAAGLFLGALAVIAACLAWAVDNNPVAPFFGAATAMVLLAERPGALFWVAAALMAIGMWLHVTERHDHVHRHERLAHTHMHHHDEHHQHEHPRRWDGVEPHSHEHEHSLLVHTHERWQTPPALCRTGLITIDAKRRYEEFLHSHVSREAAILANCQSNERFPVATIVRCACH
jgi:drug/metabolite transporter (DMT)-like permease